VKKKILLGLFLVLGAASFSNNKIEVKGAYDLGGKYHFEKSSAKGKANAMEAGAEYRYEVTPGLELGGGVAYQAHKDLKEYKADMYDSVPVYATAKYTFDTSAPVKPYVNTFQANNSIIPFQGSDTLVCFISFHCCMRECMTDEAVGNVVSCYQEVD